MADSQQTSLSSRRAWIEIPMINPKSALTWSLSSRRAWIEIENRRYGSVETHVALLTESVD